MTNNEEAIKELKLRNCESCSGLFCKNGCDIYLAISALESIDRIKAERDALMKDLKKVPLCHCCKYDFSGNDEVCYACSINAGSRWEWRGIE